MTLLELLYHKHEEILHDAVTALAKAKLPHFSSFTEAELNERFSRLLHAVTLCTEKNSCSELAAYMNLISDESFDLGSEPVEVQIMLNILEEALWKNICEYVGGHKQNAAMKLITAILCSAKQDLIDEYAILERN
ncbi:MAG: hypothetical protein IAE90_14365 [Ignavibacteria bacterium]|nr:hypothetical protein [Ignavibacteria bacterium]